MPTTETIQTTNMIRTAIQIPKQHHRPYRKDLTRTDSATEIDFTVVFVNPLLAVDPTEHPLHDIAEDAIIFDVAMDTHSGDLTTKEWGSRATLTTDEEVRVEGLDWVWDRKSEHHPTGHYQAPTKLPTGVPVVEATTEELILEVRANDDATVQFTWNLETYDELAIPESSAVLYH